MGRGSRQVPVWAVYRNSGSKSRGNFRLRSEVRDGICTVAEEAESAGPTLGVVEGGLPTQGKAIPYGVYDLSRNEGWVSVGVAHDSAGLAANAIGSWWQRMGRPVYPAAWGERSMRSVWHASRRDCSSHSSIPPSSPMKTNWVPGFSSPHGSPMIRRARLPTTCTILCQLNRCLK